MSAANMGSIENSFQNCSLESSGDSNGSRSGSSGVTDFFPNPLTTIELNSEVPLPYRWQQCLDLETGAIYYINLENGQKTRKDPRKQPGFGGDFYSEEDHSYDTDDNFSSSASPSSSRNPVLVAAGCKRCMMYFMLPKRVLDCPQCNGNLLHFNRL